MVKPAPAAPPPAPAPALDAADLAHATKARLRSAQDVAAAAAWTAERAAEAAARALEAVAVARRTVLTYADLDGRVAAYHAGLLRAGAGGRTVLPDDLAADRRAAYEAGVVLADADAAHELLEGESRTAAAEVVAAGAALAAAADVLLQVRAAALVVELREVERNAGRLRGLIAGLAGARSYNDPPLAWDIKVVALDPQHGAIVDCAGAGAGPNWAEAARRWSDYRAALLLDANAAFSG